ncbi:MAG: carbohydrate porin [Candidatus Omnitrophota bacterium]
MLRRFTILLIMIGCFGTSGLFAEEDSLKDEIARLKARLEALERKVAQQDDYIVTQRQTAQAQERQIREYETKLSLLEEKLKQTPGEPARIAGGLEITSAATFVAQGTNNANGDTLSQKGEDGVDASYSVDIGIEKKIEDCGRVFAHLEPGDGAGVEDELQVFSNVNRDSNDTDNSALITEIYYEHSFKSFPLSVMAGKIDGTALVDTNEYANDETTQFLGRIFRNSPVMEFPDNTAGFMAAFNPKDYFDAALLVMDADTDWEDMGDECFLAGQLNFKPGIFSRNGNYRLIGWRNDNDHAKWNDLNNTQNSAYGFGISLDQEFTDNLGGFLRYGWQDPDVFLNGQAFSLEQAWSLGARLKGGLWDRANDTIGLAIGQVIPSDEYKKAGADLKAENEGHLEAYYNYAFNEHLTLSPDVQFIWNPYGDDAANGKSSITIVGIRGQVDF